MTEQFKPRLYALPWAPYPRRILIYLEEKGIASSFDIPETEGNTDRMPGQPPNATVPILEIAPGRYIWQSMAILEYLEDTYAGRQDLPDLRGSTPEARSRVRELLALLEEACGAFTIFVRNASQLYAKRDPHMDRGAARKALERAHFLLNRAEELSDEKGEWLVDIGNGGRPTLADIVVLTLRDYATDFYAHDLFAPHPRLRKSAEAFEKRESAPFVPAPAVVSSLARQMSVKLNAAGVLEG